MIRTVGRVSSVVTAALASLSAAALCSWATGFPFFVALLIETPAVAAGVVALRRRTPATHPHRSTPCDRTSPIPSELPPSSRPAAEGRRWAVRRGRGHFVARRYVSRHRTGPD